MSILASRLRDFISENGIAEKPMLMFPFVQLQRAGKMETSESLVCNEWRRLFIISGAAAAAAAGDQPTETPPPPPPMRTKTRPRERRADGRLGAQQAADLSR